jgi:hypothetical protein
MSVQNEIGYSGDYASPVLRATIFDLSKHEIRDFSIVKLDERVFESLSIISKGRYFAQTPGVTSSSRSSTTSTKACQA